MSHSIDLLKRELEAATKRAADVKVETRAEIDQGRRAQRKLDDANHEVHDLQMSISALTAAGNGEKEAVSA